MAWIYERQAMQEGEVMDPRDLMRNVNELGAEMSGLLDGENIPAGRATTARLATKALMMTGSNPITADFALAPGQIGTWQTIDAYTTTFTAPYDGCVDVIGLVNFLWSGVPLVIATATLFNDKCEFRMLVGGQVVASSGWFHCARTQATIRLVGMTYAPAGTVTITIQMRSYEALYKGVDDFRNGKPTSALALNNPTQTQYTVTAKAANTLYKHRMR